MRVASISDLHLGTRATLDGFRGPESKLLEFLDHLERDHDRIVLLGDVFATDYDRVPGSSAAALHATLERYSAVARRWQAPPYTLVFGNHDPITEVELAAVESVDLCHEGFRARFMHGHQFDPLLGPHAPLTTWAIGGVRRMGGQRIADFLEGTFYDHTLELAARWYGSLELAACNMIQAQQAEVVILGHTHLQACRPCGRGVYANAGATTASHLSYVSVDLDERELHIFKYADGVAHELEAWRSQSHAPTTAKSRSRSPADNSRKAAFDQASRIVHDCLNC